MVMPKKVVVWGGEDVLSVSVEMFLRTNTDWKVIKLSNQEELEALIEAEAAAHEPVIIVCPKDHSSPTDLTIQLLLEHPDIKVITICLESNLVGVYNKHHVLARDPFDLIDIIDSDYSSRKDKSSRKEKGAKFEHSREGKRPT